MPPAPHTLGMRDGGGVFLDVAAGSPLCRLALQAARIPQRPHRNARHHLQPPPSEHHHLQNTAAGQTSSALDGQPPAPAVPLQGGVEAVAFLGAPGAFQAPPPQTQSQPRRRVSWDRVPLATRPHGRVQGRVHSREAGVIPLPPLLLLHHPRHGAFRKGGRHVRLAFLLILIVDIPVLGVTADATLDGHAAACACSA